MSIVSNAPSKKMSVVVPTNGPAPPTALYIGHIPHGFFEEEMKGFFSQFGTLKRLRIARSKKTGKSKHYGFLEFENPEVAKIVADEINNYKLMENLLRVHLIPPERVHPKLWKGSNRGFQLRNWCEMERRRHNKEKTIEEHNKLVKRIVSKDKKRREMLKKAGIEYEFPEFVGIHQAPKKIKFAQD
ncbi:hypothetical protein ZOSMA_41G00040 [Zostera marina]|uniref:RRM domain-containing protein n=1 Tax=Zostera marina TaxID=29655 RepID=A0A0K9P4M3_ZOSMR|nr:hypothetical protein ZOSMA_41G00040 [Zostera marina]